MGGYGRVWEGMGGYGRLPPKLLYFTFYRNTLGGRASRASLLSFLLFLSKIIMNQKNNNIIIIK
jgi:hypothetical protein